ncbi:hypothetical protein DRN73_06555 [Candidatus Pacearchaeota archaeon]|nr:MAG: hypothetical protein DRN73_06555 [Candidatus Pacearchaeota archaeon]
MKLKYYFTKVKIEEIDLENRDFLFSYPKRNKFLKESIQKFGVLEPPILISTSEKFKIVSGEGRILALKDLQQTIVPVIIVENLSPAECLLISLETNLFRPLNLIEKADFIDKALKYLSIEEVIKLLPKLNFSSNYIWINFLQKINKLEDKFKIFIIENKLNPKLAEKLSELKKEEKEEFWEIFQKLRLTFSEQKEVLEMLIDLKKFYELPTLVPEELKKILDESDFNKRRKKFFEKLYEMKFPFYSKKRKKISDLINNFKKRGIELRFSPYLEKRDIELKLKLTSPEDFKKLDELLKIHEKEILEVFE